MCPVAHPQVTLYEEFSKYADRTAVAQDVIFEVSHAPVLRAWYVRVDSDWFQQSIACLAVHYG